MKKKPVQGDINHLTVQELWNKVFKIADDCQERICAEDELLDEPKYPREYCYPEISYMGADYTTIRFKFPDGAPLLAVSGLIESMYGAFNCWGGFYKNGESNCLEFNISVSA